MSSRFGGADYSHLPLDRALTLDDFPDPATVVASRSRAEMMHDIIRRKPGMTLRQLLARLAGAHGQITCVGTSKKVADLIEDWFRDHAADGFNVMPPPFPGILDAFI